MFVIAALLALRVAVFPPLEEPSVPPEGPPPPRAPDLGAASTDPEHLAPDPLGLLTSCDDPVFTECFKKWRPPPPPPEPEKPPPVEANPETGGASAPPAPRPEAPPPPDAPKPPEKPPEPGFGTGSPPPPNPTADKATYDALVDAIRESGLEGKVLLPEPPKDGNTTLELAPGADKGGKKR